MQVPKRRLLALCVALLLVVAGCSGGPTPTSTPATDATATPTEKTTGTATPTATVDQYPPGVASNGTVTNLTALLDAHEAGIRDRPVAFTYEWTAPNESSERRYVRGADATPYYSVFNRTIGKDRTSEELYWSGSQGYGRYRYDDQTRYGVLQNSTAIVNAWTHDGFGGPRFALWSVLSAGAYSVDGTVERNGRTLVRLTAEGVAPAQNDTVESYEGTALVTPEGVVYSVEASLVSSAGDAAGEPADVSVTVDPDVEWSGAPAWVAEVPHLSISTVENGQALELRNTGGVAVPANTTFSVAVNDERMWGPPFGSDVTGEVTTDARLEPGEAVYVTVGADGDASSFTLHRDRVQGEYTIVAAGVRGTHAGYNYWLVTGSESPDESEETTDTDG